MADNLKDLEAMQVVLREFRTISKRNRGIIIDMLSKEHEVIGDRIEDPYFDLRKQYNEARDGSFETKIQYIKKVREVGGLPLKDAKDLVESW